MKSKMKSKLILFLLLFSQIALAAEADDTLSVELYLPGLHYRTYQDETKALQIRRVDQISLQLAYNELLLTGLELSRYSESSGGSSFNFESETSEWSLLFGYNFLNYKLTDITFNIYGAGYFGQNQTQIETTLLGQSTTEVSKAQTVIGFGIIPQMIYHDFILAMDLRWMESKAYAPQAVTVLTVKIGYSLSL